MTPSTRHLRCRRRGGDWVTEWLRCPFCGERDHAQRGSLVTAGRLERDKIEVCDRCHGHLKTTMTFARSALQALLSRAFQVGVG